MPLAKTTNRYLKHTFSQDELNAFRDTLASTICELSQLEDEKKTVTSQFAARINEKKATSNMAAQNIRNGYEFRDIDCDVTYDTKRRMKLISRKDTGEFIEDLPMTADELQCSLPGFEFEDVDEQAPDESEIDEDDWIEKARRADRGNESDLCLELKKRIESLLKEAGIEHIIPEGKQWPTKELGTLAKKASRNNPAVGIKLSVILDQIPVFFEILEELDNDFPTPDEIIGDLPTDPDPAEPDESDSDETIDENPSF